MGTLIRPTRVPVGMTQRSREPVTSADGPPARPDGGERTDPRQFPRPPFRFVDDEGRDIEIRVFDDPPDPLFEMYRQMESGDRSQGIPPRGESRLESWAETLTREGKNLVAWHGEDAVGHAVLMHMEGARWELAIFVRSDYQGAHIGSHLIRCLLGYGREEGVETVWLSVERYNDVALRMYESVGFEKLSGESEYKMERDI
jgi:GNAT superfamily N-acetyltransferase